MARCNLVLTDASMLVLEPFNRRMHRINDELYRGESFLNQPLASRKFDLRKNVAIPAGVAGFSTF